MSRPNELVDRCHAVKPIAAIDKQPRIARERSRVARYADDQRHIRRRQRGCLGPGTGPWRIENRDLKPTQFAGRQGVAEEIPNKGFGVLATAKVSYRRFEGGNRAGIPIEAGYPQSSRCKTQTERSHAAEQVNDRPPRTDRIENQIGQGRLALGAGLTKAPGRQHHARLAHAQHAAAAMRDRFCPITGRRSPGQPCQVVTFGEGGKQFELRKVWFFDTRQDNVETIIQQRDRDVDGAVTNRQLAQQVAERREQPQDFRPRNRALADRDDPRRSKRVETQNDTLRRATRRHRDAAPGALPNGNNVIDAAGVNAGAV